jgi:hypothetical protein
MGMMIVVRIISTIVGALVPLVAMSGFLSPTGSSPFGSFSSFIPFQSFMSDSAAISPYAQYLPFLAGGGGALGVWFIISQAVGGIGSSLGAGSMSGLSRSGMMGMSSMKDIEKRMQSGFNSFGASTGIMPPEKPLPADINKVQYRILTSFSQGSRKPKEVAEQLSMDKVEVGKETSSLVSNGYLTKKNRLTSKGLELLS